MELIDRKSILSALDKAIVNTNPDYYQMDTREGYGDWMHSNGFNCAITHAIITIEQSVKYDAVPVVRCKDCKYSLPNDGKLNDGARYCSRIYGGAKKEHPAVWDVDYCSGGERKEVREWN